MSGHLGDPGLLKMVFAVRRLQQVVLERFVAEILLHWLHETTVAEAQLRYSMTLNPRFDPYLADRVGR